MEENVGRLGNNLRTSESLYELMEDHGVLEEAIGCCSLPSEISLVCIVVERENGQTTRYTYDKMYGKYKLIGIALESSMNAKD